MAITWRPKRKELVYCFSFNYFFFFCCCFSAIHHHLKIGHLQWKYRLFNSEDLVWIWRLPMTKYTDRWQGWVETLKPSRVITWEFLKSWPGWRLLPDYWRNYTLFVSVMKMRELTWRNCQLCPPKCWRSTRPWPTGTLTESAPCRIHPNTHDTTHTWSTQNDSKYIKRNTTHTHLRIITFLSGIEWSNMHGGPCVCVCLCVQRWWRVSFLCKFAVRIE